MRLLAFALVIAGVTACSTTAHVAQTQQVTDAPAQAAKGKREASGVQDEGWLQAQGMPALEDAQLNVHTSVTVMEAYDERGDLLELMISAASPDGSRSICSSMA